MLARLLLLFIVVPMVELAILVWLGSQIGFWATMLLVIVTGTVGALLARSQGTRAFQAVRAELAAGRMPAEGLLDGLLILVGGVVLLTPGLLTDIAGLLLLVPVTRRRLKAGVRRRLEGMVRSGQIRVIGNRE